MRWIVLAGLALQLVSCSTQQDRINKFSDPEVQKIYDLQDRRSTDSLLTYLKSDEPLYRREAAMAFGSVQDTVAIAELARLLLTDSDAQTRINAAYALGQTGGQVAQALGSALTDKDKSVVREALMALGKTVTGKQRDILTSFQVVDSIEMEGFGWGLYYLTLRKQADSAASLRAAELLMAGNSYQSRLAAASYFGRTVNTGITAPENSLVQFALSDPRPEVRMAAAAGLRHAEVSALVAAVKGILKDEHDYRVRVNAVRACQQFPLDKVQTVVFDALNDPHVMVQVAASEVIRNQVGTTALKGLDEAIGQAKDSRVRADLFAAQLKSVPTDKTVNQIIEAYPRESNYGKAHLLSALGEARGAQASVALTFVAGEMRKPVVARVIATNAAGAITRIDRNSGGKLPGMITIYKEAIALGDPAVTGIICGILMDPVMNYKKTIGDTGFLKEARAKLTLPRDIESIEPLDEAISFLDGQPKPEQPRNSFNHPIDWKLVHTIKTNTRAEVTTSKGKIILQLLVDESPGSVSNFVALVNQGYFNEKFVHRVVPNFVIQAGCNRGDGYGSEDYSIRSDLSSRRYDTGSVGMASAGKDTEGTQWFITHCPTPHLDGKYSIFAIVTQGMEVVHQTEVGDRIVTVKLIP